MNAQQPATIHLTEKAGLPDIEFYNIIEDTEKFIWLAADKGLYSYDGREYKYFSHPNQIGNFFASKSATLRNLSFVLKYVKVVRYNL